MRKWIAWVGMCAAAAAASNMDQCACDSARAQTMEARNCGLCREAERRPAGEAFFFVKDSSPYKPNRWLALPRAHVEGRLPLSKLTAKQRAAFWGAAIEKARAMWGDEWGLAMNGDEVRSQCHMHVHIGQLLQGVEEGRPLVVDGPGGIPAPKDGSGLWIHPLGTKLHVHMGEQRTETVLLR